MLVLNRNRDQRVVITTSSGETIVVTVVDVRPGKARLGFEADASVVIHRSEVFERIEQQARDAGRGWKE